MVESAFNSIDAAKTYFHKRIFLFFQGDKKKKGDSIAISLPGINFLNKNPD